MRPNTQFLADLVTFTEEILNGKLLFCAIKYHSAIDVIQKISVICPETL